MKYRLIAIDLDGTLFGPDHAVSPANVDAIAAAQAAGALVVPCTGRGWIESVGWLEAVPDLSLGVFNTGAAVVEMDTGRTIDLAEFEPHLVSELVEFMRGQPEAVLVYQDRQRTGCDYLVTGDGRLTPNTRRWFELNDIAFKELRNPTLDELHHWMRVVVVVACRRAFEIEQQVQQQFAGRVDLHCFAGVPTADKNDTVYIVEIFAADVNKWRGLRWIADRHGIDPSRVAAIGDEVNDVAMLREAGLGVAMGHAADAARNAADRHTRSNAEDGVAYAIQQMMNGAW